MPDAKNVSLWGPLVRKLIPPDTVTRQRRIDLAITADGRPIVSRAAGVLAPEATPVITADSVELEASTETDLATYLAGIDILTAGLQTQIDGKQPLDSDLTTYATKTPPSGDVVGTTDTQTLTGKSLGNANSDVTLITGHLKHKSSAPSIAVGAALGTGGSVGAVITGSDQAGELTLTAGTTTLTTGTAATITFATARPDGNYTISLTPGGTPTWAVQWRVNNPNASTWTISFGVAPASGATFKFYYQIIEWTN